MPSNALISIKAVHSTPNYLKNRDLMLKHHIELSGAVAGEPGKTEVPKHRIAPRN